MKLDLPLIPPADIKQGWEGEFEIFPWYSFAMNIPSHVFMITTLKENGVPNVSLNAWGMLMGAGTEPKFIMEVQNYTDTCRLLKPGREFVINIPSYELREQLLLTTRHYEDEVDEIAASGLTAEKSTVVGAPRIKECFGHYECVVEWVRDLETEVKRNVLIQGKVVHAAIDDAYLTGDIQSTLAKRDLVYVFMEFYDHFARTCASNGGFCRIDANRLDQY